jgi:hypothetical protein
MELKNKYIVGVHVMFYEIEMLPEYVDACMMALSHHYNSENVAFHFAWNTSEYFEKIDTSVISLQELNDKFYTQVNRLKEIGCDVIVDLKTNEHKVYNIADYRRDLNYNYCNDYNFVLWGETDSLWPEQTFLIIEKINEYSVSQNIHKYVLFFSERKMWDSSWKVIEHNDFTNEQFIDTPEWALNHWASSKSYMTLEQMNEINLKAEELDIRQLNDPKFDGSCLVIKSDLIRSGVNIPHALLCSGEDTSFADMAKLVLGNQFVQYVIKNILRVHNRRHPKKRLYIYNENNPRGFCGKEDKGDWWEILHDMSKQNLATIRYQSSVFTIEDVFERINKKN